MKRHIFLYAILSILVVMGTFTTDASAQKKQETDEERLNPTRHMVRVHRTDNTEHRANSAPWWLNVPPPRRCPIQGVRAQHDQVDVVLLGLSDDFRRAMAVDDFTIRKIHGGVAPEYHRF